jgi:V/A-type H+-transporting ATPase subunit E
MVTKLKEGIQAIIREIDMDAERHSDEYTEQMKSTIDREIGRENAVYQEELGQRRDNLQTNNKLELRFRLERYSRRLNRELLAYRRELLDEIFDLAVKKLRAISGKEYMDIFLSAIGDLSGSFTLLTGEHSVEKLNAKVIEEAVRSKNGLSITIDPKPIPDKSGFIIKDDRVEYNFLFEDLIEDIKNEQSAQILKEVFNPA